MSKTFNLMATQSLIITISCETEFYSVRESAHVQIERLGFFFSDSVSVCVFFCERESECEREGQKILTVAEKPTKCEAVEKAEA